MDAGRSFGTQFGAGVEKASPKIERGLNKVADATGKVRVEQERLNNMQKQGAQSSDKLVAQHERLAKARRDESAATRSLARDMQALTTSNSGSASSLRGTASALSVLGGAARSPAALAAVAPILVQVGSAAAAASGSLLVLPGVLGAVGGAFGTLKLATAGFSDALESMEDPEKFAESLRKLSPAAQQAALSIQALMPALTQFKEATQEALFEGSGPQLNKMAQSLLPQIQAMTTSVATSFNQMFMGATNTLMSNPALTAGITQNISQAFQNLTPAASSLTQALAQLVATGSDFLPQLAEGAANAASGFANMISEASQSGRLQTIIRDGITVVGDLMDAVGSATEMFMSLGDDGVVAMSEIKTNVEAVSTAVRLLTGDLSAMGDAFPTIGKMAAGAFAEVGNSIDSYMLGPLRAAIDAMNRIPGMPDIPSIPEFRFTNEGVTVTSGSPLPGQGGSHGQVVPKTAQNGPRIPGVPSGGYQAPGAFFDEFGMGRQEAGWSGVPYNAPGASSGRTGGAGGGSASAGPVAPYTGDPMSMLQGMPVNAQLYGAAGAVLDSKHRLAQSEAELNALLESNDATAEQIQDKRNDIAKAEREQHEAELRLIEAKQGATESFTNTMSGATSSLGEIGAALDADLGISKGLPGLADNLVRFLGSLAMAPIAGALSGIQQGLGYQPGSAGKGIFGMIAGTGALGSQYQLAPGVPGAGGQQQQAVSGDPRVAQMIALAQGANGGKYGWGASDLAGGLADCSGAVSDLIEVLTTGQATPGRGINGGGFSTANAAQVLESIGAQRGFVPGNLNIGFKNGGPGGGHMTSQLPNGVNFESGGSHGGIAYGGPAASPLNPQFTEQWTLPVGSTGWQGAPGVPSSVSAGGGRSPVLGTQQMGPGVGASAAPTTGLGSQSYNNPVGGEGFAGVGGLPMAAIQGAISAGGGAASMFGGQAASAAAQMLMELGNRAVAFGGQAASIGVSALGETLLPSGDSPDASIGNSWFGRIAGGLAGARPATPNVAGQAPTAEQKAQGQQSGQPQAEQGGDKSKQVGVNIENYNVQKSEDRAGQDLARHQFDAGTVGAGR